MSELRTALLITGALAVPGCAVALANTTEVVGDAPTAESCRADALSAEHRPITEDYGFASRTVLRLTGVTVSDLPDGCDEFGKRSVDAFGQYKGKTWHRASQILRITGNEQSVNDATLKIDRFTPIEGPKNRGVRIGYLVRWNADDDKFDGVARFHSSRMTYEKVGGTDGA